LKTEVLLFKLFMLMQFDVILHYRCCLAAVLGDMLCYCYSQLTKIN